MGLANVAQAELKQRRVQDDAKIKAPGEPSGEKGATGAAGTRALQDPRQVVNVSLNRDRGFVLPHGCRPGWSGKDQAFRAKLGGYLAPAATASLKDFPAVKAGTVVAAILMISPV